MAQITYQDQSAVFLKRRTDWGAIWVGVFTFIAIWTVFGSLGIAVFASRANVNAARAVPAMNIGIGIWAIVLTIIAMYVAGRETAHLAFVHDRHDGLIHGMSMFGLSVVAVFVLAVIGGSVLGASAQDTAGPQNASTTPYIFNVIANLGWMGFVSLFLGWLAALWGSSSAIVSPRAQADVRDTDVQNIRTAA